MKVKSEVHGTCQMECIQYSEGFRFPKGCNVKGADPTKVYVRVQTKQRYSHLGKPDNAYTGINCARGLCLEDTVMLCVPLDTMVIPVNLEVIATPCYGAATQF